MKILRTLLLSFILGKDAKFIVDLADEMIKQNNRATQFPMFAIQEDYKAYCGDSWGNETERKDESDGQMCDSCRQKSEDNVDVPDYCDNCDSECFVSFNWEQRFDLTAGVFFTAEACEEHIRANHYHYTNPKSYGIGSWRNWEMQKMFTIIFKLAGRKAPSCYV